ncbi:MAG: hypothetical protein IT210_03080 [Armatimonadetes bacterium]|nr:hypothetical protein [Armatimonadota bacterium]
MTMYATVLRPEAIIIKSGSLKQFGLLCIPWRSERRHTKSNPGEDSEPPKE